MRVVVSPEADAQVRLVHRWWQEHRGSAPDLFAQELANAIATLEAAPSAGHRAPHPEVKGLRRILLRATHYHVYYVFDDDVVVVLAVWSAVMGSGPNLRRSS